MWQLHERAHPVLTDQGSAVLDERTGRWTQLTPTASAAVMLLLSGGDMEQAADRFAERYDIPPEQAAADVQNVATMLAAQGLTKNSGKKSVQRRWGWRR